MRSPAGERAAVELPSRGALARPRYTSAEALPWVIWLVEAGEVSRLPSPSPFPLIISVWIFFLFFSELV